ncbi:MAG: LysM peptidoglycan-binding domain-containing protein [Alphaproteobacteria bacterium]
MTVALIGGIMAASGNASGRAAERCGAGTVIVERGDTLSRIAERCDVPEGMLLAANPGIDGSGDLLVGESLRLRRSAEPERSIGSRLRDFGEKANEAVGRMADSIGSSVEDLLDRNPDLKSRLDEIGRSIGITEERPRSISVTPDTARAGSTVTVSATGLPENAPVSLGAGPPAMASEVIARARSSGSGTVTMHVPLPAWAKPGTPLVFTIRSGSGLEARSERLRIVR